MKTPINNNNLDNLFNKAKAGNQDLDDFEKDAIAGFNTLASETEAHDVKAALDKRIHEELFKKEEKNNPKIYWFAAAGLALIIGFSVLFIKNNTDTISKNSNLAITDSKQESEDKTLPDTKKVLEEQIAPSAESVTPSEKAPLREDEQGQKTEGKSGLLKDEVTKPNGTVTSEPKKRMILPVFASETQKEAAAAEEEKTERKKETTVSGEGVSSRSANTGGKDDLAKSQNTTDFENDAFKSGTKDVAINQTPKLAEKAAKDQAVGGYVKQKEKSEDDNADLDSKNDINQPVAANYDKSDVVFSKEKSKSNKNSKKTNHQTTATMAGPESNDYKPGAPTYAPKTTVDNETGATKATDKREEANAINCYYTGGEAAITKDIKEKLVAENLDQKFDATLYVNEKKVVEKVEFLNSYDLSSKQKESVVKILKTLCKFNFFVTPTQKGTHAYKVIYRP